MRSDEVDNAVGEAVQTKAQLLAEKKKALEDARARYALAREMRDEQEMGIESAIIQALREIISSIETELVSDREVTGVRAAKDRLLGIKRAWDSIASSVDAAELRVVKKIAELSDEIDHLNDRYSGSVKTRVEAAALSDRFNLPKLVLPDVAPPARRDVAIEMTTLPNKLRATAWGNESVEQDEFELRTRRTYAEASGTEGYRIIEGAGLKAWEPLTERQKEIITARLREKEQMRKQFAGLPTIPSDGSVPLGSL
jgi:hypothetical protein